MDGSSRVVLISTGLSLAYGLTLDYENQILYWVDYAFNRIESSNSDGSNRNILTTSLRDPYSVTFYQGTLYWTDHYYNRIYYTSVSTVSITSGTYLGTDGFSIQVVAEERQPEGN